ncbi:unnamed protein product [Adineta steineri]|uniref:Uncharacterized protein n=1 Tax=Adineta steineri TaxID=433720 RepID=A0A819I2G6_9BILA|nr:unnamed protein product [Adineta steineri]CAF0933105.1 unnamed protein product [Adineta steineri]CAF1218818.1 unnamed protein product [Adineta steineri]CAF3554235.1 unnamed protein product [Adineta steineri]CAF3808629.1 unnamed protein product [Adineta steineri]
MALAGNTNFLLGASHNSHTRSTTAAARHHNSIPETPNLRTLHRLTSSVQSFEDTLSLASPCTSTSYPYLEQFAAKNASFFTIPTTEYRDSTAFTSLGRVDNYRSTSAILPSNVTSPDDTHNKSSDETTGSTYLSHVTATIPSDINLPIEVRVRCIFLRVGEIDTLNERYTSEIFFEASWFARDYKIGSKYEPQMGHFNPQLIVLNNMGDSLRHDKWYSTSKTNENGLIEITEYHKFKGVFWERMELNHFPYDVQELSISLTTPLTQNDIHFVENKEKPSGVNRTVFSDQQSWHLYEHVEFQFEQYREEYSINYDQLHPVLVCTCHVGRKCGYYVWNAYFLIFLITSAALSTFSIPPSNSHGRLQITCTLLLTSVTFRWVVNKSLPTISYLTALDIYAIASIVALSSYLTPIATNALHLSLYPEYSLCRLDRYGFYVLSFAFCLYQILILLWTFWTPYKRRRVMQRKDEKNREDFISKFGQSESSSGKVN